MENELRDKELAARKLKGKIKEKEEEAFLVKEEFATLQEELESKNRKLRKLWTKYEASQAQMKDLQEEFQSEKDILLEEYTILSQQLKLRALIIDSFIPPEITGLIKSRAQWDDDSQQWFIPHLNLVGNAKRAQRPPTGITRFVHESASMYPGEPRYRSDNVVDLEADVDYPDKE
ncbi:Kinesin-like protein like protein [Aduncisulcus paluster]|uniref:Kinesin-like protein like protein n=1 Tax=Aduncisulcus paluster TaxID=2918883 RepID=A0ABQ5KMS4_9EUKA|nr:Kinesin-like protein like protein [Aduncisulcus paluster]